MSAIQREGHRFRPHLLQMGLWVASWVGRGREGEREREEGRKDVASVRPCNDDDLMGITRSVNLLTKEAWNLKGLF